MEISRFVKFFFLILLFSFTVSAYDDKTTHPAITDEIVDFYANFNFQFSDELRKYKDDIIQGSIDEDIPPRWMNHFYDPIYNRGWKGYRSSKEWAVSSIIQSSSASSSIASLFGDDDQDYSWERAIKDYVNGNKKRAYYALGHVLHLIEDAFVPDHTRNDTHGYKHIIGFSPYEDWAKKIQRENIDLINQLINENARPLFFSNLENYLDYIANYSNNNFFSQQTIFYDVYNVPIDVKRDEFYGYNIEPINNKLFKLFKVEPKKDYLNNLNYELTLNDEKVLNDYWHYLSRQAIFTGSGVIDLFYKEIEKEQIKAKSTDSFTERLSKFSKSFSNLYDLNFGRIKNLSNFGMTLVLGSYYQVPKAIDSLIQEIKIAQQNFITEISNTKGVIIDNASDIINDINPTEEFNQEQLLANLQSKINDLQEQLNQLSADEQNLNNQKDVDLQNNLQTAPSESAIPRLSGSNAQFILSETAPTLTPLSAFTQTILFSVMSTPIPTPTPTLEPEYAWSSASRYVRQEVSQSLAEETPTPTPTLISEPTPTPTPTPEAGVQPLDVVINEVAWMGTKANSTDEWIELYNNTDSDIDLTDWILEASDGSPKIEFTEEYKDKVKRNKDKNPIIKSKSYFLLERTDDNPTSETGDWFFTGALNNAEYSKTEEERKLKEGLVLKNGEILIDRIDLWRAGDNESKKSMERISAGREGADIDNWKNNDEKTKNGKDVKGNDIFGTPKTKNSLLNVINNVYDRDINFYPETIYNISYFSLVAGRVLTIYPGVIVKFIRLPEGLENFIIKGKLTAQGTADKKIYFTSDKDDSPETGGDTNLDGGASSPATGDWRRIWFLDSQNSIIENADIRYGGRYEVNCCSAFINTPIYLENSSLTINNSIIKESFYSGIFLKNQSNLIMDNTQVINVTEREISQGQFFGGYGIYMEGYVGNSSKISNSYFENLKTGIYAQNYDILEINNNQFKDVNVVIDAPVYGKNSQFSHSGNVDLGGNGGIKIQPANIPAGANLIFNKDAFPYLIFRLDIPKDAVLEIEKGVIIKFEPMIGLHGGIITIEGILKVFGTLEEKVYFTAYSDDEIGGDTNLDEDETAPYPGFWRTIEFIKTGGSQIENAVIKYGGASQATSGGFLYRYGSLTIGSIFLAEENFNQVSISNVLISDSSYYGIMINNNVKFNIKNSEINGNNLTPYGLFLNNGSELVISDVQIKNNNIGLSYPKDFPPVIDDSIIFDGNNLNIEVR